MSLSLPALRKTLVCSGLAFALSLTAQASINYKPSGAEYPIAGARPTDQVHPSLAISASGGFLVWEDPISDGEGLGISAVQLDSGGSAVMAPFRVNQTGALDQERARVSLLKNGGAAFVWQGGRLGFQHIFARILGPDKTWVTGDIAVSTPTQNFQIYPSVATLANGNIVVVWASYNQYSATSMQDVYGQLLSPAGDKIGSEFLVNQFTAFNQRNPAVAALANGGFVVTWVSEQQRSGKVDNADPNFVYSPTSVPSVDVYARIFAAAGTPTASEFLVNKSSRICANPAVCGGTDSGFVIAWSEKDTQIVDNSWDIYSRIYGNTGTGSEVARANTETYGEQFAAQVAAVGAGYMLVWNSLGQDGSMEGVYGQFINQDGSLSGTELRVNGTTMSKQIQPALASDEMGRALVVWSSYVGSGRSFDLFAQRYVNADQPLEPMNAPFVNVPFSIVNGVYQPEIVVSWPAQQGLPVDHYEIFVNGAASPVASVNATTWVMTAANGLKNSTTVSIRVACVTSDDRRTPLSPAVTATTWGNYNWGGIPFEWMTANYGSDLSTWPSASKEMETRLTLLQVFLSGGNPKDSSTWLRTRLERSTIDYRLKWNPQPGRRYQVQSSADLSQWQNVDVPRMAIGAEDELPVGNTNAYYRVLLLR